MAAHDLINAAIKANDKAMKTAIKNGYPVQLPANQYLPKAMNGKIDLIHLGQFADLDAGFDEYRKQQTQAANQDFSDLDAGFAEWSAGQGGPNVESMQISPVEAPRTASMSIGGQSTGSRSTKANTGAGTAQEEIPSLDNMAVPVTAKTTTKTVKTATKAEKTAAKEVKQANSTLSKADKALQTAQKKQTVAENNLRKKLDKAEVEAQKADAMRSAAKVTKKGNTTVIEPAQNVQQTKRKMQGLAKEEARAQAEYTKAQNDVRKAEERAKKAADKQAAANDRAQAASAFAARRTANSGTVSSAEQVTNNAVRRDIIDQAVNNQISSYNAMPKASAVRGTSGRVHSGSGRTGEFQLPVLETPSVNTSMQRTQRDRLAAMEGRLNPSALSTQREVDDWLVSDGNPVVKPEYQEALQQAVRADALKPKATTMLTPAQAREMGLVPDEVIGQSEQPLSDQNMRTVWANPDYMLDDDEYARAKKMSEDYFKQNFRGPNDRYFVGNPSDQTDGTVEEMSRIYNKTHQGAAFTGGVLNSASGVGQIANRGTAEIAELAGQEDLADALTEYGQQMDASIAGARTQHPVTSSLGTMAGKMAQYSATNQYFDEIATGLLGLPAGSLGAFLANQGAQNLQDYVLNEIPNYINDRMNGMSREEALERFKQDAKWDAVGNLGMGVAGEVIPRLAKRFGRNAADAAGDAARTAMPDDVMSELATSGRLYDDLTSGTGAQIPELTDEVGTLAVDGFGRQADDVVDAVKVAPEAAMPGRVTEGQWGDLIDGMGNSMVTPRYRADGTRNIGAAITDPDMSGFKNPRVAPFDDSKSALNGYDPIVVGRTQVIDAPYKGQKPISLYDKSPEAISLSIEKSADTIKSYSNVNQDNPKERRDFITKLFENFQKKAIPIDNVKDVNGETYSVNAYKRSVSKLAYGNEDAQDMLDRIIVMENLDDVIRNGEYVGSGIYTPKDYRRLESNATKAKQVIRYDYFETPIRLPDGRERVCQYAVEVTKDQNRYRTHYVLDDFDFADSAKKMEETSSVPVKDTYEVMQQDRSHFPRATTLPNSDFSIPRTDRPVNGLEEQITDIVPVGNSQTGFTGNTPKSIPEDTGILRQADEALDIGANEIPSMEEVDNIAARRAELQARADGIEDVGGTFYDRHTGEVVPQEVVEQLDAELREANRQFDEAVANAPEPKDIGGVRPQTVDDSDELPFLDDSSTEPPENWQALFDEPATARGTEEATSDIPILADNADEVADTANHANRSNNVTMTEEELDEAIADTPPLGPKVDPVDRVLEKVDKQGWKSREYIGKTRTNSIKNSGIDNLVEQTDVIPESLFKHSSVPEKQSMYDAYLDVKNKPQEQIDRFAKRLTDEEIGKLGATDVDKMFILRNELNNRARDAVDEAERAELYRLSREVALNIDLVGHKGGAILQSYRKWAATYDGAVATAEGKLYRMVDDQLRSNPRMQAEIDSVAHQIFDRIGEIDSIDDVEKQVHDIVRQAMEDSRYLKGKVDDATVTKLTDSILKEKSFEGIQEQLDFLATGHEHLSMDTLDEVQRLFDEASEFDYGSKDYYQREMQAYALLANDMFPKGSSFRSKFDQWRYFAMLANPTTHIKNMTGNVLFGQGAVSAKNNLAAVIEASADRVSKATGGKGIDRTKSLINPFSKKDKGLLEAARQDAFDKSYRALTGTGRYLDPARGIDQAIPTWSTKSRLGRALNAATGFNNRLLSGEDEAAMIAKYQTSLAGYLKANGYDANIFKATDDESLKVLESARAYALRQAEEAAFHQNSNLAKQMTQFTQNLRNSDKLIDRTVGTAADIAIPFKKTPINILKSCFAYSPLEFAKVAAEIPDLYKGVIKPADFIDDLSKGLTGTAGLVAGALLAHGGVIEAGSSEGDKEAAFDKTAGRQNNAVKIGGKQIGLAELVPAAAPIIFGAIMYETKRESEKNGNAALDTIVNGAMGLTDAVTDMTMLSGIADIIADAKSAQSKGEIFTNIAGGLAENLVGQMLPTVGRKAEITVDDTKRSTYSDRSGTMKQLDSSAKYWQTKIPGSQALGEKLEQSEIPMLQSVGSRLTLEPAVDAWGREIKQTGGNLGGRAAYNFLSPVTISSESQDPTDQELYALSDQTGSDDVFHQMPQTDSKFKVDGEDVKLTESQWTEYQKRNGTMAKELVDALISSDLYATMSDDDKVEAIKDIYSYTKDAAQHEVGGKVMNSTNAKMYAAYQEGGAEAVIGELEYLNGITTAENETGLEVANNAKTRGVYEEYGAEGVQAYAEMKDRFNEIKAGREEQYGKGSKNVNIMTTLTLLNENPDQAEVILGSIANNPDKYEQTDNGWVYHKGDSILTADDVTEPVAEPVAEPAQEAETGSSEPLLSGFSMPEQPQQSQAKAASKAARQQMSELRATQQPEAEEIPVLEEQPKPVQQTASNVEINPATGRPVAPTRQTAQAEPAVEIDPRTGRPKAPSRSNEVIQPQGEIPKLEPNGDATWNNSWKIENSKSYGRFRQVDPSYNASDYARVYNAMDTDNSGKLKKAEIQSYLDAMNGVDEAYRWAMFNAFAQSNWSNPYKK